MDVSLIMETDKTTEEIEAEIINEVVEESDWLTTNAPVCDNYSECESCQ